VAHDALPGAAAVLAVTGAARRARTIRHRETVGHELPKGTASTRVHRCMLNGTHLVDASVLPVGGLGGERGRREERGCEERGGEHVERRRECLALFGREESPGVLLAVEKEYGRAKTRREREVGKKDGRGDDKPRAGVKDARPSAPPRVEQLSRRLSMSIAELCAFCNHRISVNKAARGGASDVLDTFVKPLEHAETCTARLYRS
jgi:hypothetical protein